MRVCGVCVLCVCDVFVCSRAVFFLCSDICPSISGVGDDRCVLVLDIFFVLGGRAIEDILLAIPFNNHLHLESLVFNYLVYAG